MQLTPEEIGKKTRELYPKAYPKMSNEEVGNFYIQKFGTVDDTWNGKVANKPLSTWMQSEIQPGQSGQPNLLGQAGQPGQVEQPGQNPVVQYGQQTQPVKNSQYASLVQRYFPQDQWNNALAVMGGESGGNAQAIGDNYPIDTGNGPETIPSYGLFQIRGLPGRPSPQQLMNPEFNIKYAADLYKSQGWQPWTAAHKLGIVR